MAIDQRDISSSLRFMKDDVLRQYAAMHKNDPYIFPLAFQESQNRQKLRMNQQMQMAGQPQPKVNEQALAQMAPPPAQPRAQPMPEDQGIGALDAPNMKFGAEGGIMGYEGYDEGPSTFGQEPVIRMAEGGHVPRYQGNPQDRSLVRMPYGGDTMGMPSFAQEELAAQASNIAIGERERARVLAELQQKADFLTSIDAPQAESARAQLEAFKTSGVAPKPTAATAPTATPTPAGYTRGAMEGDPRLATPPSKPFVAAPTGNRDAAPRPDTGRNAPAAAPVVPEQTAAQRYAAMQKGLEPERAEIDKGIAALSASKRKTAADELSEFEKDVAERGVAFKGREERLAKREGELGKRKDELGSFAMLEFGLGLLAEPGSFAKAVGRVGQTTAKNYSAGLKDLRAAQDKMDDARDQIEEFRRNEANMTATERRKFKSAIGRTENEIEQLGLNAAEKMYGNKREDAKTIFTAETQERLTDKEIKAKRDIAGMQERGATARSMTPDKLVFDQLTKQYGGDTVKAAEALQKMKTEKFNVYDAYSKYLQAFAGKDTLKGPDDFEVFAKRFIPTVTPGKNTPIRTQPGG
jgi:hypothetical protein